MLGQTAIVLISLDSQDRWMRLTGFIERLKKNDMR